MLKASFNTLLKLIFAVAILTWLLNSGKLDLSLIGKVIKNGPWAFVALVSLFINFLISAIRWQMLLETKSNKLKITRVFPINMIGQFFSTFLPGAVTGDFFKLLYIKDEDKSLDKTFLLSTILIDRIIGLIGLILVAGIPSILFFSELTMLGPKVKPLLSFNIMLLVGALGFIIVLYIPRRMKLHILELIKIIPFIGNKASQITRTFWQIGENKKIIAKAVALSVVIHIVAIFSFWSLIHPFLHSQLGLDKLYTIAPIGFISTAIPISPAGAGVGHLVFEELFKIVKQPNGASFFNLFFLLLVMTNLLGSIPYILWKKKHSLDEAEELEKETATT